MTNQEIRQQNDEIKHELAELRGRMASIRETYEALEKISKFIQSEKTA